VEVAGASSSCSSLRTQGVTAQLRRTGPLRAHIGTASVHSELLFSRPPTNLASVSRLRDHGGAQLFSCLARTHPCASLRAHILSTSVHTFFARTHPVYICTHSSAERWLHHVFFAHTFCFHLYILMPVGLEHTRGPWVEPNSWCESSAGLLGWVCVHIFPPAVTRVPSAHRCSGDVRTQVLRRRPSGNSGGARR